MTRIQTYTPGRGRPSKAYRYISALAGLKTAIRKEVKKDVKKEVHAGRPRAETESLRVISGHIRVKRAKSRMVSVGGKRFVV